MNLQNNVFNTWLDTFISEKGVDLETTFKFDNHNGFNIMPYGVVVEAIKAATTTERAQIKSTIVKIDFANGDVLHFFRFLGRGLA